MTREEQLKYEYECKLMALRTEQNNCQHDWNKVEYDPEFKHIPKFEDRFVGSDYMPELVGYDEKKIDRWSRTCHKCGKVEYTYEQKPIAYGPKF